MQALEQMHGPLVRSPGIALGLPRVTTDLAVALALASLYLTVGAILSLVHHSIAGDAWSRVGNAYYVLYSRDPHLAAMGFVWNPLPSMLALPWLPFMSAWPPLVRDGFIMNIWSAIFMALAAQQIFGTLRDLRLSWLLALAVTLCFALHPIIIQYGANGMTEALFILLLVVVVRHLAQWSRSNQTAPLAVAGIALGVAYLVRYEAAAVGAAVGALVLWLVFKRTAGSRRERTIAAVADGLVLGAPVAATFVAWALASWLIVGQPFEQFSSQYGTASQLAVDFEGSYYGTGDAMSIALAFSARQVFALTPFLLPIVAFAGFTGLIRRDASVLVPLIVFGAVVVFAILAWITGRSGGWLRYYITVIPLAALLTGWALSHVWSMRRVPGTAWRGRLVAGVSRVMLVGITGAIIIMQAASLPAGAATLFDSELRRPEGTTTDIQRWESGQQVAAYVDDLGLESGSVLLDVFLGFPIVLHSREPRQFVITPDRDFIAVLNDPATFGVRYLLVPPPDVALGELDAINRQYPGIYEDGAGIATMVKEFKSPSSNLQWRLYRLNVTPDQ